MADAGEEELAGGVGQAAEAEATQAAVVLEAGMESFNVGGAALVKGAVLGEPARVYYLNRHTVQPT